MKLVKAALIMTLAAGSTACLDMFTNIFNVADLAERVDVTVSRPMSARGTGRAITPPRKAAADCSGKSRRRPAPGKRRFFCDVRRRCGARRHRDGNTRRDDDSVGCHRNSHKRFDELPVQHDRHRHVSGHVEHPRQLLGDDAVLRALQRVRDHQAIVTSLFR